MRKAYEAPAAKLTGLAALEDLAVVIDFDSLINHKTGPDTGAVPSGEDIHLPE